MVSAEQLSSPSDRAIDLLNDEEIRRTVEFYETTVAGRTYGPQLEGVESHSLTEALRNDPNVILLDVYNDSGEIIKWPLLVPIEHHIDYSKTFFDEHYPDTPAYHFSLPPHSAIGELVEQGDVLGVVSDRLKRENAVVAYDFIKDSEDGTLVPEFLKTVIGETAELLDITPQSKQGEIEYGLPKVVHYEGYVDPINKPEQPVANVLVALEQMVERGEIEEYPEHGIMHLTKEKLRADGGKLLDQIWRIYDEQFNTLTEDHPSLQKQPRDELERMLLSEGAVNIAFMDDHEVAGMLYFVHDIKSCVWLNEKFYTERYPEEDGWLSYYPGIVVAADKAQKGMGYAQAMMSCAADAVEATGKRLIVTCQCTNVSMTYIPKITEHVIDAHPKLQMERDSNGEGMKPTVEYDYRVTQVT